MPKRNLAWMLVIMMVALLAWQLGDIRARPGNEYDAFAPLAEARARILRNYVEPVDDRLLIEGALRGMLEAVSKKFNDPHTRYLPKADYSEFHEMQVGELQGIGIALGMLGGQPIVERPIPGGPAYTAGMRGDDVILAVDGVSTDGLNIGQVKEMIVGPEGTRVVIRVRHRERRDGAIEEEIPVIRAVIHISTLAGWKSLDTGEWEHIIHRDPAVAYVRIYYFSQGTVSDLDKTVRHLLSAGMRAMVLDLRGNPGGPLDAAVQTVDRFIDSGEIVRLERRRQPQRTSDRPRESQPENTYRPSFPLAILIDENSASAAEIVAGALQAHGRAVIVGKRSFGKASVQDVSELPNDMGAIKITGGYYRLPDGRIIHLRPNAKIWGVDPDVEVSLERRDASSRPAASRPATRPERGPTDGPDAPSTTREGRGTNADPGPTSRPGDINPDDPASIPDAQVRRAVELLIAKLAPPPPADTRAAPARVGEAPASSRGPRGTKSGP